MLCFIFSLLSNWGRDKMAATLAADIFKDNFVIENRLMK